MPKRRSAAELEASRLRARRRRRIRLGWPPERWDDPPRRWTARGGTAHDTRPGPPIPDLDRHPLVDEALGQLRGWERAELNRGMDAIARDLVGAYVLARCEGSDGALALTMERRRYARDRATLVHGLTSVTDLRR